MGPRLLVSDLDGTLLGDDAAIARFAAWLGSRRDRYRLVYASGRDGDSIRDVTTERSLPVPDAMVSSVGTAILDANGCPWPGWPRAFARWDVEAVRGSVRTLSWLVPQAPVFQTTLKASYDVPGLTTTRADAVRARLTSADQDAKLIYSGGRHLDIVPTGTGKGLAARFLAAEWGIPATAVLAFGDSGNDAELLTAGFNGTLVANALPEIAGLVGDDVYRSPRPYADGVLDGIRHWSSPRLGPSPIA